MLALKGVCFQMAAQQNENEMVRQELAMMEDSASVYKLIGPVLVRSAMHSLR